MLITKLGLVSHKYTQNLGDDIQTYAVYKLMPQMDYFIDREYSDKFISDSGEPVAVLLNGWWMWHKWNWPPSKYLYPKVIGMHFTDYMLNKSGSPLNDETLDGIGGDYFRAYGPVGTRDFYTLDMMKKHGIESEFSGCVTLTLPKQEVTEDAGSYICVVDLSKALCEKIENDLKDSGIEIRYYGHKIPIRTDETTFEMRMDEVEERLKIYQNAKCVITNRLHAVLPCLAMEVPVLCIFNKDDTRFSPYNDWIHIVSGPEFLSGECDYDMLNPPPNDKSYKIHREKLISEISGFFESVKDTEKSADELNKVPYTDIEKAEWQNGIMRYALDEWLIKYRELLRSSTKLKRSNKTLVNSKNILENEKNALEESKIELQAQNSLLCDEKKKLTDAFHASESKNTRLNDEISKLKKKNKQLNDSLADAKKNIKRLENIKTPLYRKIQQKLRK